MVAKYNSLYNENADLPTPFQFNPWKHHLMYIISNIQSVLNRECLDKLNNSILCIGESLTDLYTGKLSIQEIVSGINSELVYQSTFTEQAFTKWINNTDKLYRKVYLKDSSFWILKISDNLTNYIHIHPGKYSPNTLRVRSLTLKTAILTSAYLRIIKSPTITRDMINFVRKKYLDQPPIKSFSGEKGLGRVIELINNN